MLSYPGSKNGAGVCERLISAMPAHEVYVAAFAGHDAVFFRKRRAERSIMVDRDRTVCRWWKALRLDDVRTVCCDFLEAASEMASGSSSLVSSPVARLQDDRATLKAAMVDRRTLLYVDPPYLRSVRSARRLWLYDMDDETSHRTLLRSLRALPCMVMLSGYPSALYEEELRGWRCESYSCMTRGGRRTECIWMNYPAGQPLHDCRYVGGTFRGRERVKRRCARWVSRFRAMPPAERQVVFEALHAVYDGEYCNVTSGDARGRRRK